MTSATIILLALLSLLPTTARTRCVRARLATIEAQATAAVAAHPSVPVEVLLAVGWLESALGCDPASGGCWGAPISPRRRAVAGRPAHAASALAWGYRRCGTDLGAVSHFRCGRCRCPHLVGYQPADAVRLVERLRVRSRIAPSDHGAE